MSTPVVAIMSGGDWTDASVNFVVLPAGADAAALSAGYQEWYRGYRLQPDPYKYYNFAEWLVAFHGARPTTDDELVVWDGDL